MPNRANIAPLMPKRICYWFVALAAIGLLLRVALFTHYEPIMQPDTSTYVSAAQDLVSGGGFAKSEGRRTPGYPLLIAAIGEDPARIVVTQMALGVGTSLLLFLITLQLTGRPGMAFAIGLSYDLNLQQLFIEAVVVTEPLTTFLLAAMTATLLPTLQRLRARSGAAALAVATGVLGAAAIMVRPQFVFLVLLLPLLVGYAASGPRWPGGRALRHAALVALPIGVALLGWAKVVQHNTGYFALSTQSGFGLVNHSVEFIELAPKEYATVRDILLKYRAERIAAAGHAGNTVWYAWPEIQRATGWSLPEASRQLQRMSMQMFEDHPVRYAQSVMRAWLEFWTVPIFLEPDRLSPTWLAQPLERVWWVEHTLLRLCNLLFVTFLVAVAVSRRVRNAVRWDLNATAIGALVMCSSLLQAMADRGAGSRYAITLQAMVVLLIIVTLARARTGGRRRAPTDAAPASEPIAGS